MNNQRSHLRDKVFISMKCFRNALLRNIPRDYESGVTFRPFCEDIVFSSEL